MSNDFDIEEACKRAEHRAKLMLSVGVIVLLLSGLALLGKMSKEDNDVSEKYYCQMVHEGVQPDYNGTYKQGKCPKPLETQK